MKTITNKLRLSYDLLLGLGIFFLLVVSSFKADLLALQKLSSLVVMLFLPGYLLLAVLYPSRAQLNHIERLLSSMAASVAIVSLLGLALNETPLGLSFWMLIMILFIIFVPLALFAYYRRQKLPSHEVYLPITSFNPASGFQVFLSIVGVGLILLLIVVYYLALFPQQQSTLPTTQFYLEAQDGHLNTLKTRVEAGQPVTVKLGLINLENKSVEYKIFQHLNDAPLLPIATIKLNSGQQWDTLYTFALPELTSARQVTFFVYKNDNLITPYRSVYLWLKP